MGQFKFGSFNFPDELIEWGTPQKKPNQRQSLDAHTDIYGVTHDYGLPHTKTEIKFTTLPMSGAAFQAIMSGMRSNYIDYALRDADCNYYDDENGIFKTGHFYFDKSFQVNIEEVDGDGVPTQYGKMDWLFIEY